MTKEIKYIIYAILGTLVLVNGSFLVNKVIQNNVQTDQTSIIEIDASVLDCDAGYYDSELSEFMDDGGLDE